MGLFGGVYVEDYYFVYIVCFIGVYDGDWVVKIMVGFEVDGF